MFVTGLRLVKTQICDEMPYPVFIDPSMLSLPKNPEKLSPLENYSTMDGYLKQVLPTIAEIKPVSFGFFSGKLNFKTLGVPEKMIMAALTLLTGKKAGDHRNWDAIKEWVISLDAEK